RTTEPWRKAGRDRSPATPRLQPRRGGAHRGGADSRRELPCEPAEHPDRPAHSRDVRRRPRARTNPRQREPSRHGRRPAAQHYLTQTSLPHATSTWRVTAWLPTRTVWGPHATEKLAGDWPTILESIHTRWPPLRSAVIVPVVAAGAGGAGGGSGARAGAS